jgi:hypothetical protein
MSEDTWSLIAAGINGTNTHAQTWAMVHGMRPAEPYTNTLFDIMHNITLTDDELAEREEWVQDLMQRPEADEETFEQDLDNWESNR